MRYYDLMIEYSLHENEYLNVCKHYRQIYDTPIVKEDPAQAKKVHLSDNTENRIR